MTSQVYLLLSADHFSFMCDYFQQTYYELCKTKQVYVWETLPKTKSIFAFIRFILFSFGNIIPAPIRSTRMLLAVRNTINLYCFILFLVKLNSKYKHRYLWIFQPQFSQYAGLAKKLGWKIIFDSVDIEKPRHKKDISEERRLLNHSDYQYCISKQTRKYYLDQYQKEFTIVPLGIRSREKIDVIKKTENIALYAGAINGRINLLLLYNVCLHTPSWTFLLVGPITNNSNFPSLNKKLLKLIINLPNVIHIPQVEHSIIGHLLTKCRVGLIPYSIKESFNVTSFPMKFGEYSSAGVPSLSTTIPSIMETKLAICVSNNWTDWHNSLMRLSKHPFPKRSELISFANKNSWSKKISMILKYL